MSKKTDRKIEVPVEEAARLACPLKPLIDIRTPLEMKMGVIDLSLNFFFFDIPVRVLQLSKPE